MLGRLKFILNYLKGRQGKLDKKKIIGANVTKFRKIKGLEQIQLAEKAKLSEESISNIERGASNATIDTLTKISDALEIDIEDLFLERAFNLSFVLSEKTVYDLKKAKEFIDEILKEESNKKIGGIK